MLGKLGEFLNKDMGALVKDAGKVLNTDVGTIAKGAGKVLNTDVSTIAKGAGKVLNADLGELLRDAEPGSTTQVIDSATAAPPAPAPAQVHARPPAAANRPQISPAEANRQAAVAAALSPTPPTAPKTPMPRPSITPPADFDPEATQKLNPANEATVIMAAGGEESATALPQLGDSLVSRHRRTMPTGTSLLVLLPHSAGEFERPRATPVGELTSDPVMAMYSVSGHPVAVRLMQCWDEDEARDRLKEVKIQAGANHRMGDDGSWILAVTLQGLVFAWTRGNYSFSATAPKGEISMMRFLSAFPY